MLFEFINWTEKKLFVSNNIARYIELENFFNKFILL